MTFSLENFDMDTTIRSIVLPVPPALLRPRQIAATGVLIMK
jgi:hypothetical protein